MRVRVPIAALMGVVVLIAVGCAALRSGSELWASLLLTVDLALLGFGSLAIAYRRGARRAWWIGFAAFGWSYLGLVLGPWTGRNVGPRLATTMVIEALYDRFGAISHPDHTSATPPVADPGEYIRAAIRLGPSAPNARGLASAAFTFRDSMTREDIDLLFEHREFLPAGYRSVLEAERARILVARSGDQDTFYRVGHALSTILVACLGGLSGVVLWATRGPRPNSTPADSPGES